MPCCVVHVLFVVMLVWLSVRVCVCDGLCEVVWFVCVCACFVCVYNACVWFVGALWCDAVCVAVGVVCLCVFNMCLCVV